MRHVLVVEDDPDLLVMLVTALTDHGYTVVTAINGIEALKALRQQRPDIILLDLMMPTMSGRALLEVLDQADLLRGVHMIAMSASDNLPQVASLPQVNSTLAKPFELDALLSVLDAAADKRG